MNNKIIICDVDEVIANLSQDAVQLCNSLSGRNIYKNDIHTYDVETIFGISEEAYFKAAIETKLLEHLQPVHGSQAVLTSLQNNGYNLVYVSARSWHPAGYDVTLEWLRSARFPLSYKECLHIVPLDCNKAEYVKEHIATEVAIAVDDNVKQVQNYIDSNVSSYVFLVDQPWNREHADLNLHRINHISHLTNSYRFYK